MSDIQLNAQQLEAVNATQGPVMVFAGAGTGKTRTLISRIIHLIKDEQVAPYNILAITFTKKATNEMRERIYAELGDLSYQIYMSTIHSMCSRILRRDINLLGYKKDFEIIDEEEGLKVLNEIYKKEDIDKKIIWPRTALKAISDYKNNGTPLMGLFNIIYDKYNEYLKENNMIDFDDLLILTKELFEKHPEILAKYQEVHKYILVDEFQDTNYVQYDIIKQLAGKYNNIFVVGDDDQSIYSFRGACVDNMNRFLKDFKDAKKIILDINYRSTNFILKGSNAVIKNNKNREPKELRSDVKGSLTDVMVKECYYYEDEVRYVTDEISSLIQKGYKPSDIAILYRNSALSRNFELSLIENKIPYRIFGGFSYLKRKEIKDVLSYFRFIIDESKMVHFKRIINLPSRGIGDKTIERIENCMVEKDLPVLDAIYEYTLNNHTTKNILLLEFRDIILELREKLLTCTLPEFFDLFLEKTGYEEFLKEESTEEEHRVENLHEFRSILVSVEESLEGENLTGFEKLQIVFDQVLLDDSLSDTQSSEGVVLSTVHSVKGLEFKVVFIVALEDGIFPTIREDVDLEEERRVAYVAMTRAKEKIYLTCAKRRLIYGRNVRNHKSRFLMEYLVHDDINKSVEERNELPKTEGEIILGSKIHHQTFGYGTVVWMDEKLIQVVFEKDGSIRKLFKDHPTITKC